MEDNKIIFFKKYSLKLIKHNAQIMGKYQLVKISDAGAKTNCYLPLFICLLNEAALRQKKIIDIGNFPSNTLQLRK
jgi:hypothetical protein